MSIYVGRRDDSTVPGQEHHGSDPQVVVRNDGVERPLAQAVEPDGYPMSVEGDFEWGYEGSGPINLAAAILHDALGFLPAVGVVLDFSESVIAHLPRLAFELTRDTLSVWLDVRLVSGAEIARRTTGSSTL